MRSLKSLLVASALIATPAIASAEVYIGLDGGANYLNDTSLVGSNSDWGWVGLGQVGYSFGAPKVEFEVGYRANDEIDSWSTMVNYIHEFQTGSVRPFIGAGVGWAWLEADKSQVAAPRNDDAFAYQGIAGVAFDVTNNLALKAQYRYFATLETDIGSNLGNGQDAAYNNHSILVGLTYKFAAPAPVPVAAPAPAPEPAKPAPALKKNFIVFFDFDKSIVTPEANSVISQAAQAAKEGKSASVALTGHTDRSGSDKYNQALSLKRANAVKQALIAQGIPANQISVVAKGESAPLISTPDGAREPQNRRVEIVLP